MSLHKIFLSAVLAPSLLIAATPMSLEGRVSLTRYCASARPFLHHDVVDPASLPDGSLYVPPRPTEVMGRKVQGASRRLAMEGSVVLGLVINSVGRAAHVSVLEKSEYGELDREALSILKDADYSPATLDGAPVRACTIIKVVFKVVG